MRWIVEIQMEPGPTESVEVHALNKQDAAERALNRAEAIYKRRAVRAKRILRYPV